MMDQQNNILHFFFYQAALLGFNNSFIQTFHKFMTSFVWQIFAIFTESVAAQTNVKGMNLHISQLEAADCSQ